jgi:hypothetical protein
MMTDMEILQLADKCGVLAVRKHEWDGKQFNHTDDYLDGDGAALIIFAKQMMAQRPWVGMTDEERDAITSKVIGFNSCVGWEEDYAKAIETKLKEKNA